MFVVVFFTTGHPNLTIISVQHHRYRALKYKFDISKRERQAGEADVTQKFFSIQDETASVLLIRYTAEIRLPWGGEVAGEGFPGNTLGFRPVPREHERLLP